MERIHVWYDYSCLPQKPRSTEENGIFKDTLKELQIIQLVSRTVVMLDKPESYLGRALCVLEALTANFTGIMDILHANWQSEGRLAQLYFHDVMLDQSHLIRHALLDTAVFGLQSPQECLERLGLALNDPEDIEFVFESLMQFSCFSWVHIDSSAIITGTIPLAKLANGQIVLPITGSKGREWASNLSNASRSLEYRSSQDRCQWMHHRSTRFS